jgi:HlyD family secretion protein
VFATAANVIALWTAPSFARADTEWRRRTERRRVGRATSCRRHGARSQHSSRAGRIVEHQRRNARSLLMPRLALILFTVGALGVGAYALSRSGPATAASAPRVTVARGTVVKKAVASGQVDPIQETQVNTQLAGFVRTMHVKLGQKVNAGDPLCEVWPALTEQDLLRAERGLQQAREGEEAAHEFQAGEHLLANITKLMQGDKNLARMQQAAQRSRRSAEETLALLREGKVEIDGRVIDFVVRAPVVGHVLQIVRQGDPITPASNFGLGTVVAVLGDLDQPVFRGSVDEIDVGRLQTGMAARVTLGALPGSELQGTVQELGLRARRQDNAALFDVRIALTAKPGVQLRAGYSAVAEMEIARAEHVLVLPERCVAYRGGEAFALVAGDAGEPAERKLALGIGDGLLVEVTDGLREGEQVLERGGR